MRRLPTRVLAAIGLLVAVVLAVVVSRYASSRPDGLMRVAGDKGMVQQDRHSAPGLMPDDPQLAGLVGLVAVLVVASGATYLVRRRTGDDQASETTGGG